MCTSAPRRCGEKYEVMLRFTTLCRFLVAYSNLCRKTYIYICSICIDTITYIYVYITYIYIHYIYIYKLHYIYIHYIHVYIYTIYTIYNLYAYIIIIYIYLYPYGMPTFNLTSAHFLEKTPDPRAPGQSSICEPHGTVWAPGESATPGWRKLFWLCYIYWLVVWNMNFMTFHILGMSSSQLLLTHIFQRGRLTTNHIYI